MIHTFHTSMANNTAGALYHVSLFPLHSHASSTSIQCIQLIGKSLIKDSLLAIAKIGTHRSASNSNKINNSISKHVFFKNFDTKNVTLTCFEF